MVLNVLVLWIYTKQLQVYLSNIQRYFQILRVVYVDSLLLMCLDHGGFPYTR